MPRVYLSYRRSDSAPFSEKIHRSLTDFLGSGSVLMNFSTGLPDNQSKAALAQAIESCEFVLVVIGSQWTTIKNTYGFSRIFDPTDFIRFELETAIDSGRTIIPVLVNGAAMPITGHVPGTLLSLLRLEPVVVGDGGQYEAGIQQIVHRIQPDAGRSPKIFSPQPQHQHHVFISYSRKDTATMQRLRDDLRAAGLRVWVDEDGLEPGTPDWEQAISAAIRGTVCLVAVLSPDAEQSTWVGRELAMAEMLDKRIFPILARGNEQEAIPFRLMSHQWVDGRQNYTNALDKLLAAVQKHLSQ